MKFKQMFHNRACETALRHLSDICKCDPRNRKWCISDDAFVDQHLNGSYPAIKYGGKRILMVWVQVLHLF